MVPHLLCRVPVSHRCAGILLVISLILCLIIFGFQVAVEPASRSTRTRESRCQRPRAPGRPAYSRTADALQATASSDPNSHTYKLATAVTEGKSDGSLYMACFTRRLPDEDDQAFAPRSSRAGRMRCERAETNPKVCSSLGYAENAAVDCSRL